MYTKVIVKNYIKLKIDKYNIFLSSGSREVGGFLGRRYWAYGLGGGSVCMHPWPADFSLFQAPDHRKHREDSWMCKSQGGAFARLSVLDCKWKDFTCLLFILSELTKDLKSILVCTPSPRPGGQESQMGTKETKFYCWLRKHINWLSYYCFSYLWNGRTSLS